MRPKFSVWSDHGAPAQKPKILLAAIVVAAGVVGITALYRQVTDPARAQHSPTYPSKTALPTPTIERSGMVAATPLPLPPAVTTGEASIPAPRLVPVPELSRQRTMVVPVETRAQTKAPPGEDPETQAKAEAPAAESAPAVVAHSAEKSKSGVVLKKGVMGKKRVVHAKHHQHRYSGGYARYGQWGWQGAGWTGFPPYGNFRQF
jgi:hypothetical protein